MRTLFLIAPGSRKDQTDLGSRRDDKMCGSSLVGIILADRFKILKTIDVDSFKAHDLVLDQTVTVRQALLSSPPDDETWRKNVQKLAFVRHPNFLNVLYVVCDKSSYFVITEHSQGQSIADLLKERSRFDVEDALAIMTPLAGALDLAASFACCANSISVRWLFVENRHFFAVDSEQRQLSEWASSFVKMDVWELVRPRKSIQPSFPASIAPNGGSRKWAVRQAALLTYELLGGEKDNREGQLKRWFEPISGLGDTGNAMLYRGLQGSPAFRSSGGFFHKLKSAPQPDSRESRALRGPVLSTQENSVSLHGTSAVIRGFDRDTRWLATGVLGALVFAAFLLAVLVPERYPNAVDLAEAVQARGNLLLNANISTLSKQVDVTGKSSTGETTAGLGSRIDRGFSEVSQKENRTTQMEAATSTPTPVLASTPEINDMGAQVAASLRSPAYQQDHARSIRLKITRARSSRF